MVELKYEPVSHDHKAFLKNARKREGFSKAYNDLEEEYALIVGGGEEEPKAAVLSPCDL